NKNYIIAQEKVKKKLLKKAAREILRVSARVRRKGLRLMWEKTGGQDKYRRRSGQASVFSNLLFKEQKTKVNFQK
ncbi:MAG: hypothetical protein RR394_04180, partial [Oscillospiraceae bacterium]